MTQFTVVLVIHILLCIAAVRRIWRPDNEDGAAWQAAWTLVVLLTPLVGPVMYFGMAAPPQEKPESERVKGGDVIGTGHFTGLYEDDPKPPPKPPKKPPAPPPDNNGNGSGNGGDSREAVPAEKTESDLQREIEEARRQERIAQERVAREQEDRRRDE